MERKSLEKLEEIILNIDPEDVKKVFNDANQPYKYDHYDNQHRDKNTYSSNLNDIIRDYIEYIPTSDVQRIEDSDLFITTKNNYSANFKKFCLALGINPNNFKNGRAYAFKPESHSVIHDILSNNSDYLHILKYGVNEKDLIHTNHINENLYYFIKNEITDSVDYERAMTNYFLYFLVNSNIEIGIKSKIIDILTATNIKQAQKVDILESYLEELAELHDEINAKLAEFQSYDYSEYLKQESRVQVDFHLAKYMTNKETQFSAPKELILKLLTNSGLVDQPKFKNEHRDKLISELKKALNHYQDNDNDESNYFYIITN